MSKITMADMKHDPQMNTVSNYLLNKSIAIFTNIRLNKPSNDSFHLNENLDTYREGNSINEFNKDATFLYRIFADVVNNAKKGHIKLSRHIGEESVDISSLAGIYGLHGSGIVSSQKTVSHVANAISITLLTGRTLHNNYHYGHVDFYRLKVAAKNGEQKYKCGESIFESNADILKFIEKVTAVSEQIKEWIIEIIANISNALNALKEEGSKWDLRNIDFFKLHDFGVQ